MQRSEQITLTANFAGFELRVDHRCAERLVSHVMEYLDREYWDHYHWVSTGRTAEFTFAQNAEEPTAERRVTYLRVQIDRAAGLGVLTWCIMRGSVRRDDIDDAIWLSDNPEPPDADPEIVADSHCGYIHDRASALPLAQVRMALEEYCCLRSGERPECVSWVQGGLDGQRVDRPPRPEPEPSDAPW